MSTETETRTISYGDYLKVVGLYALVAEQTAFINRCEKTIADILGEPNEGGYYGLVTDMLWESRHDVPDLLERLKIEVEPESVASEGSRQPEEG